MLSDSGQLEAARATFDKVIAHSPASGEALVGRARVLVGLGRREVAIDDYQRALRLLREPQPEHFVELAQVLAAQSRPDDALRTLDDGLKKLGPVITLQILAFNLELGRNHTVAALARLDAILEHAPRKENWLAQRGDILLAAGRAAEARRSYEAALAAIRILPGRIQQNPPMQKLSTRINAALGGMSNALVAQNREGKLMHE
jgi:tetratricopeptide (TPR) repeat protein